MGICLRIITIVYLRLNRAKSLHLHPVILITCPDGGIGRRVRLKIWYWQRCAGSIPVPGTFQVLTELNKR